MRLFDIVKGDILVSPRAIQKFLPLFEDMQGMQVPVSLLETAFCWPWTGVNPYLQICFDYRMWGGGIVGVEVLGSLVIFTRYAVWACHLWSSSDAALCSLSSRGG